MTNTFHKSNISVLDTDKVTSDLKEIHNKRYRSRTDNINISTERLYQHKKRIYESVIKSTPLLQESM